MANKKYTYEHVKKAFESEGYTLLSTEYKSVIKKLDYICPFGHKHSITFADWINGRRCGVCNPRTKHTYEYVKQSFESEGYTLLSTEYINTTTRLDYICPFGHRHSTNFKQWKEGTRCGLCNFRAVYTYEYVKQAFESEGYTLLSTEYTNNKKKLDYICPVGHKHNISWNDWVLGYRCGVCYGKRRALVYEQIKQAFESEGYTLLSTECPNSQTKLDTICPVGHRYSPTWSSWQQGTRCGICFKQNQKIEYAIIKQSFESEGYTLLSTEYIHSRAKLKFICPKRHRHSISWTSWQQGYRCGKCRVSKPEQQLLNYVKFSYPHINVIHQDRTQIVNPKTGRYLEFDLWLPDLNKAIEMNGVAIHYGGWSTNNDEIKSKLCIDKGIDLLTVTDEEWYNSDSVRTKIHNFIEGIV